MVVRVLRFDHTSQREVVPDFVRGEVPGSSGNKPTESPSHLAPHWSPDPERRAWSLPYRRKL
uniref:Uncharacterized protein n=1 Tax=Brassica campestris TaxID=3711 RepID=A0A3P5Z945_BRACM|nr:unnamed protein product [Brassica rapa]